MARLYLQMFAEGAGAAGPGAGAPAAAPAGQTGNAQMGVKGPSDATMEIKTRMGRKVVLNMDAEAGQTKTGEAQPHQAEQQAKGQTSPANGTKPSFEELVKGEYKDDYGKAMSTAIKERIKNIKQAEETLGLLDPAIKALMQKHGLEEGDYKGLVERITDDDALYEDEALQKGIPVQTLKEMKKLEADKAMLQKIQSERIQEEGLQKHFQSLVEQGQQVKEMYPGFDLQAELQNPEFVDLTRPETRIPVLKAYQLIHQDEIIGGAMQFTAKKTAEKLSHSIAAGASRPNENGLNPSSNAPNLTDDPRTWSRERMKRAEQLVKQGRSPFES